MASARLVVWLERLVWVFIFGGLMALMLGLATRDIDAVTAWTLIVIGGVVAAAGFALIWVRSRLDGAGR